VSEGSLWRAAISTLHKVEGGLSVDARDPGNWTGGAIDKGELRGTKFGISAAAYPTVDIRNLTPEAAAELTRADYWNGIPANLPDDTRWFAFDAAFHHGLGRVRNWLESEPTYDDLVARRIQFITDLRQFDIFGRGWMRRIAIVLRDIAAYKTNHGNSGTSQTLVLHNLKLAERWAAISREPVVLRGEFVWRSRAGKLDLRKEPPA
jgi:lysozyme family protein